MKKLLLLLLVVGIAPLHAQTKAPSAGPATKYTGVEIIPFDTEKDLNVLREFQVALYENLIEQVGKSHRFDEVHREGQLKGPASGVIRVRGTITTFHKGSQRLRDTTTVLGWTSIKVHVRLEDQTTGALIAEKDLTGRVRFFGGNLRATLSLAKQVSKMLKESTLPAAKTA